MPKLLYIESSPRKERSHSIEIARLFLESYIKAHPSDDVETLNLWETDLPPMDGPAIEARYTGGCDQDLTPEQRASFGEISKWANQFKTASKYLFSLPMWNFSVPYRLKHYIDLITQPGLTFEFTPEHGYQGMVKGRTAAVIYARGGEYSKESGVADKDFQKSYFETWLRFIGFSDIRPMILEPTLAEKGKTDLVKAFLVDDVRKIATEI